MNKNNRITYRFDRDGNKIEKSAYKAVVAEQAEAHADKVDNSENSGAGINEWDAEHSPPWLKRPEIRVEDKITELDVDSLEELIRNASDAQTFADPLVKDIDGSLNMKGAEESWGTEQPLLMQHDVNSIPTSYSSAHSEINTDSSFAEEKIRYELDQDNEEKDAMLYEAHNSTAFMRANDKQANKSYYASESYDDDQTVQRAVKPFTWMQGAISVVSAVASGVVIGYLLLTLVFGVSVWPFSSIVTAGEGDSIIDEGSKQVVSPIQEVPISDQEVTTDGPSIQFSDKEYAYYVLQAGVFTQEKTRDEVLASLNSAGYKGHTWQGNDERYYVYAAVATSSVQAEPLQKGIKGIETYRKSISLKIPQKMAFTGEASELEQFFTETNDLIGMYADLVSIQLEQTSYSVIDAAAFDASEEQYKSWLETAEGALAGWSGAQDVAFAKGLKEELVRANEAMKNYQAKPMSKYLWQVQDALLTSVLKQKDWFE